MMKRRLTVALLLVFIFVILLPLFAFRIFSCDCCSSQCDFDGNGVTNSNDAIYLLRNTLVPDEYPTEKSKDINGDGAVNSNDAIYLLRHTLNPTKYPMLTYDDSYMTEITEIRTDVVERTNRPQEFERGSSYDELIFYASDERSNEEKLEALPSGAVILDENNVLDNVKKLNTSSGNAAVVDVNDNSLPFTKAIRVNVTKVPENSYGYQLGMGSGVLSEKGVDGDALLMKLYVRCPNKGESGKIELIIEQSGGSYDKSLKQTVVIGNSWTLIYAPSPFREGYDSVYIRFGFKLQTVEIGGFELVNYGGQVEVSDLPASESDDVYSKDAPWRQEALERIEEVRKVDIKVVVTDSNGNPISGAKTDIEMYEHEFEWGTSLFGGQQNNETRMTKISSLCNAAVLGNELKWTRYEANPTLPKTMIETLRNYGINTVRGHCLVWDRVWKSGSTSVPDDLPGLYNDRQKLTERIEDHIFEEMQDMDGYIKEWDVLNEACNNTEMQDIYGRELIKEWFDMARATGVDADLYYNDFTVSNQLFSLLDAMENMGVDYDGIGVQSHYGAGNNILDLYAFYTKLASYGKKLKVTEYDFNSTNQRLQAEFTRDLMILTFSFEEFEGFYMWTFQGANGKPICYDEKWQPKMALEQMEDLIYNKWMTRNSGRTDGDGVASFDGFYGSYKISVIANGVKKTVWVDCHKGNDNTVYIQMP